MAKKKAGDPYVPPDWLGEPARKPLPAAHRRAYRAACSSLRNTLNAMAHYDPAEPTVSGLAELVGDGRLFEFEGERSREEEIKSVAAELAGMGVTISIDNDKLPTNAEARRYMQEGEK